ncbi:MAG: phosphoribosyltransferase [Candidatus Brocadia sp. AMX2]|nr:MAG: phosphoribosyltransferase [Candidatus Brocadia sp. AMX2]MBC6931431.1 phosphoribosyltransferase [Candidatus Brocadia sp.]MBL1167513.1 phosphoribosyltransferase [Candidatus Brocadia sp. AMX1]NOG40598.1 phosphoribosyltransferase [Planctomycetota bacterium]MCE7867714.1 phosphoribosyltransferase [Candidatus Brocadia sp. AMX2]
MIFENRRDAGRQLAEVFTKRDYSNQPLAVLGIPRGGVVVADEVAGALSSPLDVVIVRKLRAPYQPELGIGAVVDGDNINIINEELVRALGVSSDYLNSEIACQREEIERRLRIYRGDRLAPEVTGKTVIVIDDGIATGYTFRAALEGLRRRKPAWLVAAAPVAAQSSIDMLSAFADEMVFLSTPVSFFSVGTWYHDFDQVSDEEAVAILHRSWSRFKPQKPVEN